MGYVKKTLGADEELIYRAKFNWSYDFISWIWLIAGLSSGMFWVYRTYNGAGMSETSMQALGAVSLIAATFGVLTFLARYIKKWTTVIAITTVRLIIKTGLVSRSAEDISLDKIEQVELHQSILGRICLYGRVIIRGSGIGIIELPPLDRPVRLLQQIENAIALARKGKSAPSARLTRDDAPAPQPRKGLRRGSRKLITSS